MAASFFGTHDIHDYFQSIKREIDEEIEEMSEAELQTDVEVLVQRFVDKYALTVPVLGEAFMKDQPEVNPHDPVVLVKTYLPFDGDGKCFHIGGSSRPLINQELMVMKGNELLLQFQVHKSDPDSIRAEINRLTPQIEHGLTVLREELPRHAKYLPQWVKQKFEWRKQQIQSRDSFRQTLSTILPMRKREEAAKIIAPVKRQPLPVMPQKVPAAAAPPNAIIEMAAYEDILKTIEYMVHVFERSPATFHQMEEEDLRMILLVALNGLYGGEATGETFNGEGKTDILIRHEDKNVFIAECLEWKGHAYLLSKMDDQLFKYATWRDSKLAVIVFNKKNKDFTDVIAKMKETTRTHTQCVREVPFKHDSGARFEFRRADDAQKTFILTCLAFNVP